MAKRRIVRAGWLLALAFSFHGCSADRFEPVDDLAPSSPQFFMPGAGAAVVSGTSGLEAVPSGTLYWFTSPTPAMAVYNGTRAEARVVVTARVAAPCPTPVRVTFAIPGRQPRTVSADQAGSPVRFVVNVPPMGAASVPLDVDAVPCRPPADARTLFAGLLELAAVAQEKSGS